MFEVIFVAFFLLMLAEVLLFLFLNLPFPKAWKSAIFRRVAESPSLKTFLKVQLLLCILAALFYLDMSSQEHNYQAQKHKLRAKSSFGAELKKSTLSYQILKIQRNKYINFIVIFTFVVTVTFFWIKQHRYELEARYQTELAALQRDHPELTDN